MKKDTFAQTLLTGIFAFFVLALPIATALPEPVSALPSVQVIALHDEVEIEVVPDATVQIVDAEISIEYIAQ